MASKDELLAEAARLGIEGLSDDNKVSEIQGAIKEVTEGKSFPLAQLEAQSQALFGVPRSVIVGAKSKGFISDPATKAEAERAIKKFLEYGGEG